MKIARFFLLALILISAYSAWTPAPAQALAAPGPAAKPDPALVSLKVINRTYGPLVVSLAGYAGSYSFWVPQGIYTYSIAPGKYTYSVKYAYTSICSIFISDDYIYNRVHIASFSRQKNTLGPYRRCPLG
jgi:hypothetical protein